MGLGLYVTYNDATFGSCTALIVSNAAGVLNLLVYYPNGTQAHKFGVAGANTPAAGQYDADTFPTVQST